MNREQNQLRTEQLSPLQKAALAIKELRARLENLEKKQTEPIAIIGMGCRFPGGVNSPEAFWSLLHEGVDAVGKVPVERWDIERHYDPEPKKKGKIYTQEGAFLTDIDQFDAAFFDISPREAHRLDPQQRLLLQVSWEALERAGYNPTQLKGSATAVFLGMGQNDYAQYCMSGDIEHLNIDAYDGTGNGFCFAAGRLSYILGLQGPNLAVDTACSSSLVGMHLACQSLRSGESDMALAGGVHLVLTPIVYTFLAQTGALAPDGRSKAFDASADGFGRGEGCGMLVLKRLSDAQRDGDNILALIEGSAVNHDGPSSGLTVPNQLAQTELIKQALNAGGIAAKKVGYIEAHGTGTALGDPLELEGLAQIFRGTHTKERPLYIGSVKANIGHLEAAAGVAGVMKAVLALHHGIIPTQIHFKKPNPRIDWANLPFVVPTENILWEDEERIAGISSFGLSGTNSHFLLSSAPKLEKQVLTTERSAYILPLSAKSSFALNQLSVQYQDILKLDDESVKDICFTAAVGRADFSWRRVAVGNELNQLRQSLVDSDSMKIVSAAKLRVAFLCTGQGSQYINMGRELYETAPLFRETIDRCDQLLEMDRSLLSILYGEEEKTDKNAIHQTIYTQPALFAVEYALAQLWLSWGMEPTVLIGHSIGEIVAACLAGVFSLEDGLRLVSARASLMQALPQNGSMVSILGTVEEVTPYLVGYERTVSIAAVNGATAIVISGKKEDVAAIITELDKGGIKNRPLDVSHPFHSPLMEPMLADFARVAAEIKYDLPRIRIISNLTGELVGKEMCDPNYWVEHVRQPVLFAKGMERLMAEQVNLFVEIGPAPILTNLGERAYSNESFHWLSSLWREKADWVQLSNSVAEWYLLGGAVDWSQFYQGCRGQRVVLPTYPFGKERYWRVKDEVEPVPTAIKENQLLALLTSQNRDQLEKMMRERIGLSEEAQNVLPELIEHLFHLYETNKQVNVQDLLYRIIWEEDSNELEKESSLAATLFVGSDTRLTESLVHEWVGESALLDPTTLLQSKQSDQERLDLWKSALETISFEPELIIYLVDSVDSFSEQFFDEALNLLYLVKSVANCSMRSKIVLVTQGAISILEKDQLQFRDRLLWGMGRSLSLEKSDIWGGMVDLEKGGVSIEALSSCLAGVKMEKEIVWRDGRRYLPRLRETLPSDSHPMAEIKRDAAYLITGGTGFLGVYLADYLVSKGARTIYLISRRGVVQDEQRLILTQLEKRGANIAIVNADVSDLHHMQEIINSIQAEKEIKGIFHLAGMVEYCPVGQLDEAQFRSVVRGKASGSWILHQLTTEMKLDYFVLFSSISSAWGSKGQISYAGANAFLDLLASYRQQLNLPGLSIHWGPWGGGGMVKDKKTVALLESSGVIPLTEMEGKAVFDQILGNRGSGYVAAKIDWTTFLELYALSGSTTLFSSLNLVDEEKEELFVDQVELVRFDDGWDQHSYEERIEKLISYLQEKIGQILEYPEGVLPDEDTGFFDMGIDSLMAVEIKKQLQRGMKVTVETTAVFNYPTIILLANQLAKTVLGWSDQKEKQAVDSVQIEDSSKALTETEVDASLLERLNRLRALAED